MKQKIIACFGIMTAMLGAALAVGPLGTIQLVDAKDKSYCFDTQEKNVKGGGEITPYCLDTKQECENTRLNALGSPAPLLYVIISDCYKLKAQKDNNPSPSPTQP
jgi:hypothetical protein